ncbi:Hypothetical predicted protein [Scomber scombrus]|uniref:Uncharacterized protein n=1 Tax=Scomber scombrus TaxID=13677 RepID=A0AAV1P7C4_SCOSC
MSAVARLAAQINSDMDAKTGPLSSPPSSSSSSPHISTRLGLKRPRFVLCVFPDEANRSRRVRLFTSLETHDAALSRRAGGSLLTVCAELKPWKKDYSARCGNI